MAERNGGASALGDDFFVGGAERDGVQLVRDASRQTLPKRFYKDAQIEQRDNGFAILLDGRPVRTPKQNFVVVPTAAAATLLATEWAAQAQVIDPATMPATRLVNSALDGVATDLEAVAAEVVKYAGSDLVCYRAAEPPALVAAQAAAWDPILRLTHEKTGARFNIAEGVMFVAQPPESIEAIGRAVNSLARRADAALRIAALNVLTTLTGSALIALAVHDGVVPPEEGWQAAHVDEDEQMRVWGLDAEALRRRAKRHEDYLAAVNLIRALD